MLLNEKLTKQLYSPDFSTCSITEITKKEHTTRNDGLIEQKNEQKVNSLAYPLIFHFKCSQTKENLQYGCGHEHRFELFCTRDEKKCSDNYYIREVAVTVNDIKSFEYIYETECPCGYKRIIDGNGLDEYKNHKSFETEHFDTKKVFDFVGAKRFLTSGPTKITHLFSLTNGKCKLEVEYYFKKSLKTFGQENQFEQKNIFEQMKKLFENFVKVTLLNKNALYVAKLTGSRLLHDSTGKIESGFKQNKLLFDEVKMVAPLKEFLRYRIRYIFFNEKRQGKKWESDLGMDVISTEIMKGMKEITDVTGFKKFEEINLNDFIVVKNKQGYLSVKFIYIHETLKGESDQMEEGNKNLKQIGTKEEIKKSLKLNRLVNNETTSFYHLVAREKEIFVESKKRVIKAYGKLFWLKLFVQGFIKLDNVDKSLISSYLIPRTCLYALSGNLKKFEIKGKDDNDFLFKSWQEFVKGEEKTKTKNFKNFDELLGKMFDSDWLNNCMRGNEKNDKEDEDKVIKCAKKIQEKLKEKKNRELSNESRVGKFSAINNKEKDHILNILLKLLDEFLIASSGKEFSIILPDISEYKFPMEAFISDVVYAKDESSIFKSLEYILKYNKKYFVKNSPYNEMKNFNEDKEKAKPELNTYQFFNNCWINLTMSGLYESIISGKQEWVKNFPTEHNFDANDDFYKEN
uniref:Uncharacterized protein n=1 Tax=Meloidogyne enterolobii TaxID=390850 RepID=A0A6V7TP61_MELEN|nr:unnamed protein product [Meloidogyne enterolobii]